MQNDIDKLVGENIKLAQFFSNKAFDIDPDEAFSLALAGLLKATQTFDASLGFKFSSCASNHIKWELGKFRNHRDRIKRGKNATILSLQNEVGDDGAELGDFIADGSDPLNGIDGDEENECIAEAMAGLSPKEQQIIEYRFGIGCEPKVFQEIAEIFGITYQRVIQIESRAMERLRKIGAQVKRNRAPQEIQESAKLAQIHSKRQKALEWRRQYYRKHLDKIRAGRQAFYKRHSDRICQLSREYRTANLVKCLAQKAEYRAANREKLRDMEKRRYHDEIKHNPLLMERRRIYNNSRKDAKSKEDKNRVEVLTDGYIRSKLHNETGLPSKSFSEEDVTNRRNKIIAWRKKYTPWKIQNLQPTE